MIQGGFPIDSLIGAASNTICFRRVVPFTFPNGINQSRFSGSHFPPAFLAIAFNSFSANAIRTGTSASSENLGCGGFHAFFSIMISTVFTRVQLFSSYLYRTHSKASP